MTTRELRESWKRTEAFLLAAEKHLPGKAKKVRAYAVKEFHEYLSHNELELALDMLDAVIDEFEQDSLKAIEFMAKAATNMELWERQQNYDEQLSKTFGSAYKTTI